MLGKLLLGLLALLIVAGCTSSTECDRTQFNVMVVVDTVVSGRSAHGPLLRGPGNPGVPGAPGVSAVTLSLRGTAVPTDQIFNAQALLTGLLAASINGEPRMGCNGVGTRTPEALEGRCSVKVPLVPNNPARPCDYLEGGDHHDDVGVIDHVVVDLTTTFLKRGLLVIVPSEMERWAEGDPYMTAGKIKGYQAAQEWAQTHGCGTWANDAPSG